MLVVERWTPKFGQLAKVGSSAIIDHRFGRVCPLPDKSDQSDPAVGHKILRIVAHAVTQQGPLGGRSGHAVPQFSATPPFGTSVKTGPKLGF